MSEEIKSLVPPDPNLPQDIEDVRGLTVLTAAVFIAGEIAGSGILTLPYAVEQSGWIGIAIISLCCALSMYTGIILAKTWQMVQSRYKEYSVHARYPYPAMGQVTFGKPGRYFVSFCINFTLFGAAVVFILLASANIQALVSHIHHNISLCYWLLIIGGVLIPVTWFGSPKDFWPLAIGAVCATALASLLLTINIIHDIPKYTTVKHSTPTFVSFFSGFGTICFAFGGHPAFPTFQTDMKNQLKFGRAVVWGYLGVILMYLPVSLASFFVYGGHIDDNILKTISSGPLLYIVEILITLHLVLAFTIVINPVCQEVEELLKIPVEFNWRRCVLRTAVLVAVLFVAESIPRFGSILSLVGGSTVNALAYICPSLFYMKMVRMHEDEDEMHIPLHIKVLNCEIILLGLLVAVSSTYSAVIQIIDYPSARQEAEPDTRATSVTRRTQQRTGHLSLRDAMPLTEPRSEVQLAQQQQQQQEAEYCSESAQDGAHFSGLEALE